MTSVLKPPAPGNNPADTDNLRAQVESAVRDVTSSDPLNTEKIRLSITGYDAEDDLDVNLTTPESSQFLLSRDDDLDRLVSPNPGVYNWGLFAYEVNTGTAPVTALAGRARGNAVYAVSASGRAYGDDPQIHGVEITVGVFASVATATTTNGSAVLSGITVAQDSKGCRFAQGMAIAGTNIPGGTTILSVAGRPGAPTSITMSANASGSGSVTVTAEATGTIESVGLLITGNGGTAAAAGNPDGIGILLQAQNEYSRFDTGLQMGASAVATGGTAIKLASHSAARGLSFESVTYSENAVHFSNVTTTGAVISFSGTETGTSGINFATSNVFSIAAINLPGQNIATDTTTGMKIGTSALQKIALWGGTPVVRPAFIASPSADAASLKTAVDAVRTLLININAMAAS